MIYDRLENLGFYRGLSPEFASVIDFLQKTDLKALAEGRHDIDAHNYATVKCAELHTHQQGRFETHRRYADIQIALTEGETIDAIPAHDIGEWEAYDEAKDLAFSNDATPGVSWPMRTGSFGVFFPQDAHKPCCGEGLVSKIIVKVYLGE